jgi:hypothetical protein
MGESDRFATNEQIRIVLPGNKAKSNLMTEVSRLDPFSAAQAAGQPPGGGERAKRAAAGTPMLCGA